MQGSSSGSGSVYRCIVVSLYRFLVVAKFIHVFKCISAKIAGKIRLSVHESETSFNPEWDFRSPWSFNPRLNEFEVSFGIET